MSIDQEQMLPIGTLLKQGEYRVVRYIASGGFGNTYEVEHVRLGKRLAVKEFFMRGINQREGTCVTVSVKDNRDTFDQMRDKFFKEAQRLARLEEPHIVEVTDFFDENQTAYYVMKLIEGESLSAAMKRIGRPFFEYEVRLILPQVLQALKRVHGQGIYHLDLKPGNIMLNAEGHCWLIDFGASKQLSAAESQTLSTSTGLCYTPGYAPSEQVNGNAKRIGPWTDFYALGATLYNLLTNQAPPELDDVKYDGMSAFHFPSSVSTDMRQLVLWLMQPDYPKRPQTVEEIEQYLKLEPTIETAAALVHGVFPAESKATVLAESKPTELRPSVETVKAETNKTFTVSGYGKTVTFRMMIVEAGTFLMGSKLGYSEEIPVHAVTLTKDYYMGETEVTQELWEIVMGSNPSYFEGDRRPVEQVSWEDCQTFLKRLNSLTEGYRPAGRSFRLPIEAEWEFAAKGGNKSIGYIYSGSNNIDDVAWYTGNSGFKTHEVAGKQANELGLYDMGGNVWEWCYDGYGNYSASAQTDPIGPANGFDRVIRGGSWDDTASGCRCAYRGGSSPSFRGKNLGFRLAL